MRPLSSNLLRNPLAESASPARHYSARDVNTAECTERQSKVAGYRAKHGTEHSDGRAAVRMTLEQSRLGDCAGG